MQKPDFSEEFLQIVEMVNKFYNGQYMLTFCMWLKYSFILFSYSFILFPSFTNKISKNGCDASWIDHDTHSFSFTFNWHEMWFLVILLIGTRFLHTGVFKNFFFNGQKWKYISFSEKWVGSLTNYLLKVATNHTTQRRRTNRHTSFEYTQHTLTFL